MAAFPLRVVYMKLDRDASLPPVSVLISVPKKRFHHAVDRNRMKRLVREAYRTQKGIIWKALEDKDYRIAMAFICITDKMPSFSQVNKSITKALVRVAEKI